MATLVSLGKGYYYVSAGALGRALYTPSQVLHNAPNCYRLHPDSKIVEIQSMPSSAADVEAIYNACERPTLGELYEEIAAQK